MITEKHTASDGADIEPYRKVLDEVDRLIEAGDAGGHDCDFQTALLQGLF